MQICPNCKRVTCEGCEDEDKYIRATRHIAQQIREKNKRDQEIVQRHIESNTNCSILVNIMKSEMRTIGKYVYAKCKCGDHLIDLFDLKWNDHKVGIYSCNKCEAPLICRGDDGNFYYIGERI